MSPGRVYSGASPKQVVADLAPLVDFREEGLALDALADLLQQRLVPHLMRYDRPEFQSMFNAFPEPGAALGARLALDYNQGVTNWQVSPGGATLEELSCQALCRLFRLASTADATFLYAGTYANQQALYMALHRQAEREGFNLAEKGLLGFADPSRLALAASHDAHFSLRHAVRTLGLGEQCLVPLEVDGTGRIDLARMERTLHRLGRTRDLFCLVVTAGTTSTGTVEPIQPAVQACEKSGAWLHVDGAYGLAYSLLEEWRPLFEDMERADSICWDPHKQFRVPIPSSVLFARRRDDFGRMAVHSHYFNPEGGAAPNPGLKSMASTRPLSALPLVTSIRHQGLAQLRKNLRAPLDAIRAAADYVRHQPDLELAHHPDTGILCFRVTPEGIPDDQLDRLQRTVYDTVLAEGKRSISITTLGGRAALRVVAISPSVTLEALMDTLSAVRALARAA
jgi:L-2,4-diaminobutyrate decarboxylase